MTDETKVSVIVATYRRDGELLRALDSLSAQSFSDFEIIVVDDNDDEYWNKKVENIISSLKKRSSISQNIKYLKNNPHCGSAQTRNNGIHAAEGKYITFLDDDDIYFEDKIKYQYEFMEERALDFSITDLDLYFDDGKLSERRTRDYINYYDKDSLLSYHLMYHITGTDTIMFRRDYINKIGCFPGIDIGDEFYLMQNAIEGGGKFGYLNRCDVKAFVHGGEESLSSGESKINGENRLYEYKRSYFHQLNNKSIRFIKMRHFAVLAFAGLRMNNYTYFIKNSVLSFLASPVQCVKLLLNR